MFKIMSVLTICCTSLTTQAYQVNLSFDSLFPLTWYQKGLESSLSVWQTLVNISEKNEDAALLSFDLLLGRLAFAQFCINRMCQESAPCVADDKVYFSTVLCKVKQLLSVITLNAKTHDFIVCIDEMLESMQEKLS